MNSNSTDPHQDAVKAAEEIEHASRLGMIWTNSGAAAIITTACRLRERDECIKELVKALQQIEKGEGAFSRDQLQHAANVIDNGIAIASSALAKAKGFIQ